VFDGVDSRRVRRRRDDDHRADNDNLED